MINVVRVAHPGTALCVNSKAGAGRLETRWENERLDALAVVRLAADAAVAGRLCRLGDGIGRDSSMLRTEHGLERCLSGRCTQPLLALVPHRLHVARGRDFRRLTAAWRLESRTALPKQPAAGCRRHCIAEIVEWRMAAGVALAGYREELNSKLALVGTVQRRRVPWKTKTF